MLPESAGLQWREIRNEWYDTVLTAKSGAHPRFAARLFLGTAKDVVCVSFYHNSEMNWHLEMHRH
jgi:hypothetical protein